MKAGFSPISLSVLAGFAAAAAVTATPTPAAACGQDAYFGQICIMAGSYCPHNTAEAAGQLLAINGNEALYSLLGTTYGGDGKTNFSLPDMRGRAPVGWGTGAGLTGHPVGELFGQESAVQDVSMMAPHSHEAIFTPSGGGGGSVSTTVSVDVGTAAGDVEVPAAGSTVYLTGLTADKVGKADVTLHGPYTATEPTTTAALGGITATTTGGGGGSGGTVTVGNTGGGQPILTVPPEIAVRYCIVTNGIYPPRE